MANEFERGDKVCPYCGRDIDGSEQFPGLCDSDDCPRFDEFQEEDDEDDFEDDYEEEDEMDAADQESDDYISMYDEDFDPDSLDIDW